MIKALSGIKEGDRTAWDNSVIVYTSDNGETHHSNKRRWPIVVLGNAGGKLKADGRFRAYPMSGSARALTHLYATVAVALDVPGGETFGKGGVETTHGPLSELL